MFRGKERDLSAVWSLVRFHVSFWALVTKAATLFYLVGTPSFSRGVLVSLLFFMPLYSFIFLSMKVAFIQKQKKNTSK